MRHPAANVRVVYGMTEAGWVTCSAAPLRICPRKAKLKNKFGKAAVDTEYTWEEDASVGALLPGFEAKIRPAKHEYTDDKDKDIDDDNDNDYNDGDTSYNSKNRDTEEEGGTSIAPSTSRGELFVKSSSLFLSYLTNGPATLAAFDHHGFLRTGDIASVDGNGRVYIHGREKDVIKVRGWQVAPCEVEEMLRLWGHVMDGAVVGLCGAGEERVGAVLVVKEEGKSGGGGGDGDGGKGSDSGSGSGHGFTGKRFDLAELKEFLGARLARYKITSEIVVVERLPRDGMGEIKRAESLSLFQQEVDGE